MDFKSGYGPNVVCTIKGQTDEQVVIGAHLDSRNQNINNKDNTPGGNDDGCVARVSSSHSNQVKFTISIL